jgi:hypothetical protein
MDHALGNFGEHKRIDEISCDFDGHATVCSSYVFLCCFLGRSAGHDGVLSFFDKKEKSI